MRAAIYEGAGGPEVITIGEVPKPEVRPEHIRVRVHAAGLNRADIIQRRGHYAAPSGWPANIPGLEYAGEVEAVRPGVTQWRVGDRVMGLVGGGAQAEPNQVDHKEVQGGGLAPHGGGDHLLNRRGADPPGHVAGEDRRHQERQRERGSGH